MRILFTGGSSFTGYWFVRTLAHAGHEVFFTLTRPRTSDYEGVRRQRVDELVNLASPLPNCLLGDDTFFLAVAKHGPWDMMCHHGAQVTAYKSSGFPVVLALLNNINNFAAVLAALHAEGCRRLLLTGSVFESDEGAGDEELRAFSAYGLSKTLTFQAVRYYCQQAGFQLGKFVIPNPFGPYEQMRFTSYLADSWLRGATPQVKTPDYLRDNIHVDLLALAYLEFVEKFAASNDVFLRFNPSCYVETQGEFARRFRDALSRRWPDVSCELEVLEQTEFPEPVRRANTEDVRRRYAEWNEEAAWDHLADYYRKAFGEAQA